MSILLADTTFVQILERPTPRAPLRILQVSTADIQGGAEAVAFNLLAAYRERGHVSRLAVGEKHTNDPDVWELPDERERSSWSSFWRDVGGRGASLPAESAARSALRRVAAALADPGSRIDYFLGRENFRFPGTRGLLAADGGSPDVFHAHNLHGDYFDLRLLPAISRLAPLVLTLHDAWLLSGHCAHSLGCERWRIGCGVCPDLSIYPTVRRDWTRHNFRRKRSIFERSRLHVATPSRWLMRKVEDSVLAAGVKEGRIIPNGVDLSVFRPGSSREARLALGLPLETPVLLATAADLSHSVWKDFPTLRAAVSLLADRRAGPLLVIVLGPALPPERLGGVEIRFVAYERDPVTVAGYYRAADAYVHTVRADTFPLAVLEALACGTPVIASDVGGIPEQVEDGATGLLVPPRDPSELAARLELLLEDEPLRRRLGEAGAARARASFDFKRQVDAYLDWYAALVTPSRAAA